MMLAGLFISGRDWLVPSSALCLAAIFIVLMTYRHGPAGTGVRLAGILLKLVGLAALGFCLLEPLWSTQRARPGSNFFAVMADNSQGLRIRDQGAVKTRGEELRELLTSERSTWLPRLDENFQVRRYQFDSRLATTKDFSDLDFEGRSSALATSLRTLADRYKGQPLAGVLLLTDGNATDLPVGSPADWSGLPPIYPVVLGRDDAVKDIAIEKVAVSQTSFEDAPVTVEASVGTAGFGGTAIVGQLWELPAENPASIPAKTNAPTTIAGDSVAPRNPGATNGTNRAAAASGLSTGRMASEQILNAPSDGGVVTFRFQVRPLRPGISFYRLRVFARGDVEQFANPSTSREATLANNTRTIVVDRGRGPFRVLYVSGRPNWEFKFMNRALAEDDQVQVVGLIRVARREPKFEFKGRAGDASNPFFRGFDRKQEDVERYDQPVLVRLNTRDESELVGGFPKTAEDLFGYHAIILDDLEAEFFSREQMMLVQKFVSERGGGFLMLGGMESLHEGKYDRTPIGELLPVYLSGTPEPPPVTELKFGLSREGWLQPWIRLRNNESDEKRRLDEMPTFEVLNQVRSLKPGASVIATVTDSAQKQHPALAVQRFGRGRAGALMIGDLWRWGLRDEALHRDMDKAWRQMVRWLVADIPGRVELVAQPQPGEAVESMQIQVRARDPRYQPLDNATVKVSVRHLAGSGASPEEPGAVAAVSVPLGVEATSEAGVYETAYVPRQSGTYVAEVVVTDPAGVEVGRTETGWTSDPAAEEFRSLKPNRALLETIARQTGGEVVSMDRLDAFVAALPSKKAPITESVSLPFWHTPFLFLLALACFAAEWGLRRYKGMA